MARSRDLLSGQCGANKFFFFFGAHFFLQSNNVICTTYVFSKQYILAKSLKVIVHNTLFCFILTTVVIAEAVM